MYDKVTCVRALEKSYLTLKGSKAALVTMTGLIRSTRIRSFIVVLSTRDADFLE